LTLIANLRWQALLSPHRQQGLAISGMPLTPRQLADNDNNRQQRHPSLFNGNIGVCVDINFNEIINAGSAICSLIFF
jgi:hypothetical protein